MNLWRLELLRLGRTHRWLLLFGVYGFFAVVGPLTARYFNELMGRFGGDITIVAPDPTPLDGLLQFIDNGGTFGLLALVVVAAGALAMDARPEVAAFLRTRVPRPLDLLVPRYVVAVAAGTLALVLGTVVASAMTASLLGPLPAGAVVVGTLLGALYLAFVVALVAAIAGVIRGQVGTVFATFVVLLAFPILGLVGALRPWLPSELLFAVVALADGTPVWEFARSIAVTLLGTGALLAVATLRFDRREL